MAKALAVKTQLFEYDEAVRNSYPVFCGVDEAGRGHLPGMCMLRRWCCRRMW